jgi:hypothetical protein
VGPRLVFALDPETAGELEERAGTEVKTSYRDIDPDDEETIEKLAVLEEILADPQVEQAPFTQLASRSVGETCSALGGSCTRQVVGSWISKSSNRAGRSLNSRPPSSLSLVMPRYAHLEERDEFGAV